MKLIILSLLLIAYGIDAYGQPPNILSVTSTSIVFVVEETNVYIGLQCRSDLALTDPLPLLSQTWRAAPIEWGLIAPQQTNSLKFYTGVSNAYFRIVASSNMPPYSPTIAIELTLVNASTTLVTDVDLQMVGSSEHLHLAALPPSTTNTPHIFHLPDFAGVISGNHGIIKGYYFLAGQSNHVFFMPEDQRIIMGIDNSTYTVTNIFGSESI